MRRGRGVREEDETYEGCSCLALRSCNASAKAKPGSEGERGCESERVRVKVGLPGRLGRLSLSLSLCLV